jgi:molecular chaperone DnaK
MVEITREEFDSATASKLEQTIDITRTVLEEARALGSTQIDRLLLVGGSSLMPPVATRLREEFGLEPELSDPHMAVAKGAALWGQKAEITVTIADELRRQGVEVNGNLDAVDEAKLDEAVQAVAPTVGLTREAARKLVETEASNVCSRGFGIIAYNESDDRDEVFYLIHRNNALPKTVTEAFSTLYDDQAVLKVQVREQATQEEEQEIESTTEVVGGEITGLPPGYPKYTPVEVTFAMDNSGRLTVTAKHPGRPDPLVLEQDTGSVITQEQIDESRERMAGIVRQR